jgi:hypothetical protein
MLRYKRGLKTLVKTCFFIVVSMLSDIFFLLGSDLRSFPIGRDVAYWGWAELSCRVLSCRAVSGQLNLITKTPLTSGNDLKSEPNQRVDNRLNRLHHHHRHHFYKNTSTAGCDSRFECIMKNTVLWNCDISSKKALYILLFMSYIQKCLAQWWLVKRSKHVAPINIKLF